MRAADQARLAARTGALALIVGEPGCGKQWLARAIHALGPREYTFISLDCAHLPPRRLEELLGGGLATLGSAGTLYLREPSRLPHELQRRVIDLVQQGSADRPRVLAGCSAPPAEEIQAGRLLEEFHGRSGPWLSPCRRSANAGQTCPFSLSNSCSAPMARTNSASPG